MTKNSTIKRILIMVTTILSITMFSLLAVVAVSSTVLDFHRENNISRAATTTYDFANGALTSTSTNYTSNTNFTISTKTELQYFSDSVYNGCSFQGKKITLESDIDLGNTPFCVGVKYGYDTNNLLFANYGDATESNMSVGKYKGFQGVFDGNSYVIKNIKYDSVQYDSDVYLNGEGFFYCLGDGAHIQNLKISNITHIQSVNYWYMGGVTSFILSNATIENCWVDEMNIQNLKKKGLFAQGSENTLIGGIGGGMLGTTSDCNVAIKNCCVTNMTITSSEITYTEHTNWILGYATNYFAVTISDCAYSGKSWDCAHGDNVEIKTVSEYFSDKDSDTINDYKNFESISKYGDTIWQKNATNDRPYLTIFTKTTEYTVKTDGNGILFEYQVKGSGDSDSIKSSGVSEYKLKIPSGVSVVYGDSHSGDKKQLDIKYYLQSNMWGYDPILKAQPNSGYTFMSWRYESNIYTAVFMLNPIKVTFGEIVDSSDDKPDNLTTPDTTKTYYVEYGTTIQIKLTPNFKTITFPVKDEQGNNVEPSYEITGYGWYFSYLVYNNSSKDFESETISLKLTEDTSFLPVYSHQLYQVRFYPNSNTDQNNYIMHEVEYGEELSINKQTNNVEFNLTETSDGSSHSVKYNANLGYSVSGVTFSTGSAAGNTYTVKSHVDINVTTQARTDTAYKVTFNIAPKVSLSDGTTTISQSTMNMYSTTTLKYLKSADLSIIIQVVDNGITYKTFVYTPSSDLSNPRLKINDETKLCGTEQTYNISADTTITPIFSYPVTIEKNTLVGMTADEKIGIDYGSAATITFSTTDIDSKSYDVVTITYYNNGQANTKTYTINNNLYFIKTVTVDGTICKRENKKTTINFGANNLAISITTAQKTYNAVFN